jgi:hypothetical protein
VFSGEGPLVGAAEQEQCFGEVDRSGVDEVEPVDKFVVAAGLIVAGHVEKCLRDGQRVRSSWEALAANQIRGEEMSRQQAVLPRQ